MKIINNRTIELFFNGEFRKRGLSEESSKNVANALIRASLMGIDSHGVRLFRHYIDCLDSGRVKNSDTSLKLMRSQGVVTCDANNTFSHNAAQDLLVDLNNSSNEFPIQMGVILNSDHYGASGIHAFNSDIEEKLIISFTNADALANSPDGKSVVFGTNPVSCVFRSGSDLLYIDFATTKFSMNRVKNHRLTKEPLPNNTARDVNGDLTNDPFEAVSLEPIGSHKGFALAFLIEILTSGLTGMGHSTSVLKMYGSDLTLHRGVSHTFIMIDPKAFPGGVDGVKSVIDISRRSLMPEQRSASPGIKEMNTFAERMKKGIPVDKNIINEWIELGFNEN